MSELLNFHIPKYFSKNLRKEMGELYASSTISNLALAVTSIFEPIFLYNVLHFTVPLVLLFMAVVYATYIVMIPFGGKFASNFGYRHSIALSVPFQIFYWLALLASISHPMYAFLAAPILALQKSFYWPGFHSVMAYYGQTEQVGREFGAMYALENLSLVGGPLIGGIFAQYFGMPSVFLLAAIIYCFSIIPLLLAAEVFVPRSYTFKQTRELYKTFPKKFLGYLGFGDELLVLTVWPIFIYLVATNYKDTGLLAAGASLVATIVALFLGKVTDTYTKRVMVKIGAFFNAIFWVGRFFCHNFITTFTADSLSRTSRETLFIPLSTLTYLRAEATHVVPYAVFFEQSLAIGKLSACLIGALLFYFTGSFMVLFIVAGGYSLLYMYI
ncbi:MAG: MFS transporter [Candidatus Doudnabacteria bacterium]|nr:MFS transporter [Candidatus Doudnabacteria bacterium]